MYGRARLKQKANLTGIRTVHPAMRDAGVLRADIDTGADAFILDALTRPAGVPSSAPAMPPAAHPAARRPVPDGDPAAPTHERRSRGGFVTGTGPAIARAEPAEKEEIREPS